jgi:nitroreductase
MNVIDALKQRHSVRQFKSDGIPHDVLGRILEAANNAPSNCNAQPYKIAVAQGDIIESLRDELYHKFLHAAALQNKPLPKQVYTLITKGGLPDGDFKIAKDYKGVLLKRRQATGYGLYETLGIDRKDREGRDLQMARNFQFFDAPTAVFIFAHESLKEWAVLDAGIYAQSLMLAATEEGIGSCAQGALATWASPVKKHFRVDKEYKLILGVSLGYEEAHVVNQFQPERAPLQDMMFKPR